jgi:ADP-ribose pyrophosphatase YjhB (NUDIX family)
MDRRVPDGDTHERAICPKCRTVFYENPKIVTGVMPLFENKVLLCQRRIEPRQYFWTVPSGYMELNETLKQAALRESKEEAGIFPEIDHLHTVYDLPHIGQVYFLFKGTCSTMDHTPGIETMASKWFEIEDINWDTLAFDSVAFALRHIHQNGPHYGGGKA